MRNKDNMKTWKVVTNKPFLNCEHIHPLQQCKVAELIDDLTENNVVDRIIVFGSSVTDRCNNMSDVDIYYEAEKRCKIKKYHDFPFDVISNHFSDDRIMKEINEKGVVVYERKQNA